MNWTIRRELALGFGLGLLGLALVSILAWFGIARLLDQALEQAEAIRDTWSGFEWLSQVEAEQTRWVYRVSGTLLDPGAEVNGDPAQCDFARWPLSAERRELEETLPALREPLRELEVSYARLHQSCLDVVNLLAREEREAAQARYQQTAPLLSRLLEQFRALERIVEAQAPGVEPLIAAAERHQRQVALTGVLFALGVALAALLLSRHIVAALHKALGTLADLSARIAATSRQQEETITSQAAAVDQTTATIHTLTRSAEQVANQAEDTASGAARVQAGGEEGSRALKAMRIGTADMTSSVEAIGQHILLLNEQTGQIGAITRMVREIAGQTNMLSLNASVEAARAGEHGRGFAVVAREIRKLAEESRKSAEHIDALVGDIQQASNTMVMVGEAGDKAVEQGVRLADETADALQAMSFATEPILQNAQQIALSAREQRKAILQVRQAMEQLNGAMGESASGVRQLSEGMARLDALSREIRRLI